MTDPIDDALEMLEDTGAEYCGGLVNHGPMAADAMIALGRPEAVLPWVDYYRNRLIRPERRDPVTLWAWTESLGNCSFADWRVFFETILSRQGWIDALRDWVPRLSPGFAAAGAHGVIRTGHAARSLTRRQTPQRIRELAAGLAYWASRYQRLPALPGVGHRPMRPWRAMRMVRRLPRRHRKRYGLIGDRLKRLEHFPRFAESIHLLDTSSDPARTLSEMTETFARICLTHAGDIRTVTDFAHTVTAAASVRKLIPFLDRASSERLLRHAWQTGAAIYAVFASREAALAEIAAREQGAGGRPVKSALIEKAIGSGDEHAIKFTEACLSEHRLNPKPVYLEAAQACVERIAEIADLTGTRDT